ncbi:hypothetical protein [Sphingorhabdus sp. EL138]|uniref:hypothetical protein n=1 Tax=Sphingorhabdus sp. EL138 TaxID=2073156 RepID=UPI002600ACCF|nr:hypothetical protein [Sphingorhabdus sp. EL138]
MDAREQIKRAILLLPKLAAESESKEIKADIDLMMGVASQLVTVLVSRNDALAKQCSSRKSKPPKPAPQKQPQQQKPKPSNTDTQNSKNDSKDRSKALSSIQQGIRQAEPSHTDQQRALRGYVYGAQNDEVAFRKAAQAIAR